MKFIKIHREPTILETIQQVSQLKVNSYSSAPGEYSGNHFVFFLTDDASRKFLWWDIVGILYAGYQPVSRNECESINTVNEYLSSLFHWENWVRFEKSSYW